jgi:hypothetical protein
MITEKQAACLDALRAGGTIADAKARCGGDAVVAIAVLRADGLLDCDVRTIMGKPRAWYTHTEKGHAAWLSSLR